MSLNCDQEKLKEYEGVFVVDDGSWLVTVDQEEDSTHDICCILVSVTLGVFYVVRAVFKTDLRPVC